jgi:predicted enzyme related to lactoylglutathione lyase
MSRVIHFEIHAAEPQRAIAFYQQVFGWRFQQWGEQAYWLVVTGPDSAPGINGGLILRRGPAPFPGQAVNAFVCTLQVEALEATLAAAQEAGAVLALATVPIPGVGWLAYITDPEGNLVGLMQPDAGAA